MAEHIEVVVIGAGQAGLATSFELTRAGVEHVVLERGGIGETWRGRWDSFCLVTPNWSVQLPGGAYGGDDPDGFMPRDEIVDYLERYATTSAVPVRTGVDVISLSPARDGFVLETTDGEICARAVVAATGAYLYFVGVHFLRKRKSSLLLGVGEDAAIVAGSIATSPKPRAARPAADRRAAS